MVEEVEMEAMVEVDTGVTMVVMLLNIALELMEVTVEMVEMEEMLPVDQMVDLVAMYRL